MSAMYDVVVVGAGFAGLTAARELAAKGCSVTVVEGRDRIGGRTWTDERMGRRLEMGGQGLHWSGPHAWAEITRYGLELTEATPTTMAYWLVEGQARAGSMEELAALVDGPMTRATARAAEYFPNPYKPFDPAAVPGGFRDVSAAEHIHGLGLDPVEEELVQGIWAGYSGTANEDVSHAWLLHMIRTYGGWQQMSEVSGYLTLTDGTAALASAIAADAPEIRLGTTVVAIEQGADEVTVATEAGDTIEARAAIVTVPRNALRDIRFSPALSETKQRIIAEGQASAGVKVWARLRGVHEPFFALGDRTSLLTTVEYKSTHDGDTLVYGFGPSAARLDGNDREAVAAELKRWLPDVEVVETACHDWVADRFAQQIWFVPRPGQFADVEEMQRPEGRVHLAGGDYARGGPSSIDGAVEGGLVSARRVERQLAAQRTGRTV